MPNAREIETITARYVNPVKAGGKFASIKTPGNKTYYAEPHVIERVQHNQTIAVDVETQLWGKGTEKERKVPVIIRVLDEAPRVAGTQAPEGTAMQPMYRKNSVEESAEMFVRGVMCSVFHGLGTVPDARTIANMVYHLRQAWTAGFAADLKPLPPKAEPPPAKAVAAEGPTAEGFKQLGQALKSGVPETLRKSLDEALGGDQVPF